MRLPSASQLIRKAFGRTGSGQSPAGRAIPSDILPEETNFRMLTENSGDVIMQLGPDTKARYVSLSCTRLLGWLPEEMVGHGPEVFVPPEHLQNIAAAAALLLAGADEGEPLAIEIRRKDGKAVWVETKARIVRDPLTGVPGDFVLIMRDITERKRLEEQLRSLAMTDGLTGLGNRRAFDETLDREWRRTVGGAGQMSLLLLDIDRFKGFNDKYGHQVGDDCLRAVAAAMRDVLHRPGDLASRYGGEELAVILPDTDSEGALEIAERLRIAIENLDLPHDDNPEGGGHVTVSIGSATALSRSGGTIRMPEGLLLAADTALYKAKHKGRNRVEVALLLASEGPDPV
ncbi:diguanylate cyclase [Mesorhizobium sp. YC-39]|uniref:sensor domain-containing diguanylate cyclase n=1 Tax=unclassified Mesorhizobium TaxID=325217 RepID=UPI0021E866F0|nr:MULTISPECIES: diguanylate cyclase [unclassified Mesorhizobium]MCV3211263.1 diguanylate cyclase [Mesorhizobium sp. YC-2]MCV3233049.1 diguanylate cyclase [Mesorhizobium sp. YC-39]